MKTTTMLFNKDLKILFMKFMNVAEKLVTPKGIRTYSTCPQLDHK